MQLTSKCHKNSNFQFSDIYVKRLALLNELLKQKEAQAYQQAQKLETVALNEMSIPDSFVLDYEVFFSISLFSAKSGLEDGTPFYETSHVLSDNAFSFFKKENQNERDLQDHYNWIFNINHNEFQHQVHPLRHQHHCWLFHCLYHHEKLSWLELINTDEVWVEVKLVLQNFTARF